MGILDSIIGEDPEKAKEKKELRQPSDKDEDQYNTLVKELQEFVSSSYPSLKLVDSSSHDRIEYDTFLNENDEEDIEDAPKTFQDLNMFLNHAEYSASRSRIFYMKCLDIDNTPILVLKIRVGETYEYRYEFDGV